MLRNMRILYFIFNSYHDRVFHARVSIAARNARKRGRNRLGLDTGKLVKGKRKRYGLIAVGETHSYGTSRTR